MEQHTVFGLARRDGSFLLVRHRGDERLSWWLPGGVVEPGEPLQEALRRELLEETGLQLVGTPELAFVVQLVRETEQGSVHAGFAFHFACALCGRTQSRDPDGPVIRAEWVTESEVVRLLEVHSWYDCRPLADWLAGKGRTVYFQCIE
ncbi:8-oxo-dGTP diphosphatase [Thermosporothrix hazakensis]|uniref:8-oxo-dGTP diphosphatase n=1 Tax=Thermosporothrix hazakensis TaxID=644383 RepID=A0A326UA19_THEHA|nr:NUDIX hydrolase [Thermosporothrix hazakensis]PZW29334.1 8-oxo-dGTP diphosphatase [Thermosporothrix hazakensis]GCE45315.1 hypothetical protein KTH_01840 [Thermosporothrix hazakensis]